MTTTTRPVWLRRIADTHLNYRKENPMQPTIEKTVERADVTGGATVPHDDLSTFLDLARFAREWIEEEKPESRTIKFASGHVVSYDELDGLVRRYLGDEPV